MRKLIVFTLSFLSLFLVTGCNKKENIDNLSANLTCYEISIDLDVDNKTLSAHQTIDYINSTDTILKILKLHLYPQCFEEGATHLVVSSTKLNNAYPGGMSYSKFDITRVAVNGQDTTITYSGEYDDILDIDLGSSLLPDNRVTIDLDYSITLPHCEHRFGFGEDTINLANFYPIMCVYENGNFNTSTYHPNGDPFYSDMANYMVDITLDDQYVVAGTGESEISYLDNKKTVRFTADLVRDFAMVISDKFEIISKKINDTTISYYYYDDPNAEANLQAGIDSIETFSRLFGSYPYPTLSIVKNDFVYGGMEYPTLIMISDSIEDPDDFMNVIVHETAHQWWYGMVGNNEYLFPWLDEAITEYSTLLFYDENDDYEYSHEMMLETNKSNYSLFVTVYEDVLGKIDTSMRSVDLYSTEPEYTYCTYVKGVLMYESLYQLIGEKAFIKGLSIYFNDNKYTNATPEDLISAFEQASNKDLSNFFDSWIAGKVIIR